MNQDFSKFEEIDVKRLGFKNGGFAAWSPFAKEVSLLFYKDFGAVKEGAVADLCKMTGNADGVWTLSAGKACDFVKNNQYYKYRFTFNNSKYEVCDIWSKCASPDSLASELCELQPLAYYNPFGKNGKEDKVFSDAVIFEMHIRDWSRAFVKDSSGKFIEIADAEKLMEHLKELGVTHVQLLPSFDYANKNEDLSYNWGYDPFNFNVPEGRYVSSGYEDGKAAVEEMRKMIKAFHDNGIAVNMDVVYNHTSGTGSYSLYDMTVPGYFYRLKKNDEEGIEYFNGSGCGNELASNHKVVREFIIDSLKHWMLDYGINGFRFDLMGVFEPETMKEIYARLKKIDKNVLVYGEPWCGGECGVEKSCTKEVIDQAEGVACFNDNFRDAIKGAEFCGFKMGQVQGVFNDKAICTGLTGSLKSNGGFTQNSNRTINYVECHDNYTLFDKLAISYLGKTEFSGDLYKAIGKEGLELVRKQNILSAAFVILAQGVPFINGGQEFMRTKQGDENSYISSDEINAIDFTFKEKNAEVFSAYIGLFALRRANRAAFGHNEKAQAEVLGEGLVLYKTEDFCVIFNSTKNIFETCVEGYSVEVDVLSGEIQERPLDCNKDGYVTVKVRPLSFIILKKS
ncbi:pullulanase PulA [Treponema sp. JC4]|uniref:alpha-amylase family glycosyl hydrolase n=1 Tax=Treponema sp. JC4 TaxID=1124982 RepID=UPI00025B0E2A|nr:alpha-amylase family glycosyl hydrolase [Treponema sp. JC4]EID84850.1 pullulanase PulA [Treponema sp. JC4]